MAGVLVAYFSRTGATERLATQLAARLGADLESVKPLAPYAGRGGYLKAIWHSLFRRAPAVDCQGDPADYSVVIIGSPVWAGRLCAPMRSYLTRFRGRIGLAAAFWVSGSGLGYSGVRSEIEQLSGQVLLASASFGEWEVRNDATGAKLEAMAQAIRVHLPDAAAGLHR
jgi:flavodoxin